MESFSVSTQTFSNEFRSYAQLGDPSGTYLLDFRNAHRVVSETVKWEFRFPPECAFRNNGAADSTESTAAEATKVALSQVPHELIEACRDGDKTAVEELISLITPDLYRIIFSIVRDHDDTDEVLQETLIRVFRYVGALKDIGRFPAWVMRIAVNQVQTFRVRKNRNQLYEIEDSREISNSAVVLAGTGPEDACDKLMREQMRVEISAAMATLPERQRMATSLFEVEGLSIKEIAQAMQCSEGAVKFSIHEGRKKLKRRLMHLVQGWRWGRRVATESGWDSASGSFTESQVSADPLSASEATSG